MSAASVHVKLHDYSDYRLFSFPASVVGKEGVVDTPGLDKDGSKHERECKHGYPYTSLREGGENDCLCIYIFLFVVI